MKRRNWWSWTLGRIWGRMPCASRRGGIRSVVSEYRWDGGGLGGIGDGLGGLVYTYIYLHLARSTRIAHINHINHPSTFKHTQVLAFEPMAHNLAALRRSLCANPDLLDRVTVLPFGLGELAQVCCVRMYMDECSFVLTIVPCHEAHTRPLPHPHHHPTRHTNRTAPLSSRPPTAGTGCCAAMTPARTGSRVLGPRRQPRRTSQY